LKPSQKLTIQIFLLILIISFSASCAKTEENELSIIYGLTLAPSGIDPHINASAELGIPLSSVYDTLVFQDPDNGAFIPGLAESWTISSDGLVYTFKLREDVKFHDGTAFNAKAVDANLQYILNPDHVSQKAIMMLGPIEG
jgi:peptide/nickel transport system substrate-binding protein